MLIIVISILSTIIIDTIISHSFAFENFLNSKQILSRIYADHRVTLYCQARYDSNGSVLLPLGFTTNKHKNRARRIEWEHVVPAENFGRAFREWREGHLRCVKHGKPFRGRRCAEMVNPEYRRMQADMHNLFPAIGAVNAARNNYNFQMLPGVPSAFGSCPMKIGNRRVEPPPQSRGVIARTYFYMDATYRPRYRMNRSQRKLFQAWDAMYPPDAWECERARRIKAVQGNANEFTERRCRER